MQEERTIDEASEQESPPESRRPDDPGEPERLLRLKEVLRITGLSRSHLYALIKDEKFPKQLQIEGSRAVSWVASEVNDWVRRQINGGPTNPKAR